MIFFYRCDGIYNLTITHQGDRSPNPEDEVLQDVRYGYISADHLNGDKIAYAEQSSEGKIIISSGNERKIRATMIRVPPSDVKVQERIHVFISAAGAKKLPGSAKSLFQVRSVHITFELKYSYFHRLHMALDLLSPLTIARLVPTCIASSNKKNYRFKSRQRCRYNLQLDSSQMDALQVIMNAKPDQPVIVVGSFGTGKTRLLARAVYEILEQSRSFSQHRVLVCAHHQQSADAFLEIFGPMVVKRQWWVNMVRMVVKSEEDQYYKHQHSEFRFTASELFELDSFDSIDLLITTFGNALHLDGMVEPGFFTHILMDEGAQTREPENIAPLFLCGPETVVAIAGDHKQVSK